MKHIPAILFGLAITAGLAALASCTTWKTIVLPNGNTGYTVDCSGTDLSWSHCYQKAGRACPHGYDITERSDQHSGKVVPGNLFGLLGGSVQDRSMLIQCKDANGVVGGAQTFPAGAGPAVGSTAP